MGRAVSDLQMRWVATHPFLSPIAELENTVAQLLPAEAPALPAPTPNAFEAAFAAAFEAGTPLLAEEMLRREVVRLSAEGLHALVGELRQAAVPQSLLDACVELKAWLRERPRAEATMRWVLSHGAEETSPPHAGVVRFLGWAVLRRLLAGVLEEFETWRADKQWTHADCPTCGAAPMMAQLVNRGGVRHRLLSCGCCQTKWKFQRIGCPHCGNEAQETLDSYELEGEGELSISACRQCQGYVKTWAGASDAQLFLADWSTLHLDALAAEEGLRRHGTSLYDL